MNYKEKIKYFDKLKIFSIIATPRSGSDYLQSLLDSHPEIVTFNGSLPLYTSFFDKINFKDSSRKNLIYSIKTFTLNFYLSLNTKNDFQEGKNKLGKKKNKFIKIPIKKYKNMMFIYLKDKSFNKKNFYLAVHFAYNLCLNKNFKKTKVLLLHPHNLDEFILFNNDFKNCFYFFTIRHHIAAYYSTINNLSRHNPKKFFNLKHSYVTFYRCMKDSDFGEKYRLKYLSIKLEDLPHKKTLLALCKVMKIKFNKKILKSTFAGLDWNGDNKQVKNYKDRWEKNRTYNLWREKISYNEKKILNFIFNKKLKHYNYSYKKISFNDYFLCILISFFPTSFEKNFFNFKYFVKGIKKQKSIKSLMFFLYDYTYYFRRVLICLSAYIKLRKKIKNRFLLMKI